MALPDRKRLRRQRRSRRGGQRNSPPRRRRQNAISRDRRRGAQSGILRTDRQGHLSSPPHPARRHFGRTAGAGAAGQGGDPAAESARQRLPAQPGDRSALFTLFSISQQRRKSGFATPRSLGPRDPRARHLQGRGRVAPAAPLPPPRSGAAADIR